MIYQFIHDFDIYKVMRKSLLSQVTDNDAKVIKDAESAALTQIKTKIGQRYDLDAAFPTILKWDNATQYNEGQYVYHEFTSNDKQYGIIYWAIQANINKAPNENTEDWGLKDPRNSLLVMCAVDMMLYHLHARISPNKVPTLRKDRYAECIATLDMIREGEESIDIDITEDSRDEIRFGFSGGERRDWQW